MFKCGQIEQKESPVLKDASGMVLQTGINNIIVSFWNEKDDDFTKWKLEPLWIAFVVALAVAAVGAGILYLTSYFCHPVIQALTGVVGGGIALFGCAVFVGSACEFFHRDKEITLIV